MAVSEKAKEKFDEANKEIKEAIDNLRQEVSELTNKVKEKLKGGKEEVQGSTEELTKEVKTLSDKVKDLVPKRRRKERVPTHVEPYSGFFPDTWERPLLELRRATDRLFDDFFRNFGSASNEWRSPSGLTTDFSATGWPRVDIDESDDEIRITAELPGVDKDNIDVSVADDRITIRGEKKEQDEKKGRGYYQLERSYGSFQRSFPLPWEVEPDGADASFKDGILSVKLPKSAEARERIKKIAIRAG